MKEDKIMVLNILSFLQSVKDIQLFFDIANFCKNFIKNFNVIAIPLPLILHTTYKSAGNETYKSKTDDNREN